MTGKPYQSMLIPYEDEILSLRKQRPPVAFVRIAELLREKHQVSIQRAAICKFVKRRARWKKKEARENRLAPGPWNAALTRRSQPHIAPKTSTLPLSAAGTENRRPWLGWQEKPASRGRMLTTFTPSNEYNLTRLTPEEAAAYVEQLRREKNGG